MITEKFAGTIENAYGKTLPDTLKFEGSFQAYETVAEIQAQGDMPSDKEIIAFRNAQRKAAARQAAFNATLEAAGIEKPTLENDPQLQLRTMYKTLIAAKKTHAEARATASRVLGIEWADGAE